MLGDSLVKTLHLVKTPDSVGEWSLNEGKDGEIEEHGYVPWSFSLNFEAKNLIYLFTSERELDEEIDEDEEDTFNTDEERISAQLEFDKRDSLYLPISFFGAEDKTERDIKDFSLNIYKRQSKDKDLGEACYIWGVPEYETEIDFRQHHQDDCLGIELYMEEENFNELKSLVISKSLVSLD